MLKLDLQMFSDDVVDTGTVETAETETQYMSESEQFEALYNGINDVEAEDVSEVEEVDTESTTNNDIEQVHGGDTSSTSGGQQSWKTEQNARFAMERRKQEEAQRIEQAKQQARDAVYAEQYEGKVNPYTNQPIKTEADYKAYIQQYNAELISNSGIQQAQFEQIINSDPRIIQAQQIIAQQQAIEQQSKQRQEQMKLSDAVAKIKQFDKNVKTEQDVINNPHFDKIAEMYNRGYSLEDAYYLANRAELEQKKQAATRQQTINQVAGKQHLKTTGQNGVGNDVHIPADIMSMYREMTGMSDDAIRKHYSRLNTK